jgi:creatinine amidohydrolase/Fe(II)-dependent formamide hydrolase-like protein
LLSFLETKREISAHVDSPAGACGDATRADASLGKELIERAAKALAALAADVARYSAPPLKK